MGKWNFLGFAIVRGSIDKLCPITFIVSLLVEIELQIYPNLQKKLMYFEVLITPKSNKLLKKEQNLYFKEPKEHFFGKSVLYQTIKTKERL